VLCNTCNNVWGSQLETEMKSIVKDTVREGAAITLTDEDISTIATFSIMKSFICDYMEEDTKSFYDRNERHSFRQNFTFPRVCKFGLRVPRSTTGCIKRAISECPSTVRIVSRLTYLPLVLGASSFRQSLRDGLRNLEGNIGRHPESQKICCGQAT
jgi:hypothetical protein